MAKFYNKIGYSETIETSPGIWEEQITEKFYRGDILKNYKRWQSTENLNDNIIFDEQISIVADEYLNSHAQYIKYVVLNGSKWKVSSISFERPRVVLNLGGLYNGQ